MWKPAWSALMLLAVPVLSAAAQGRAPDPQTYPTKPIRAIVPFTAGSATDFLARVMGPKMLENWGQQVVVDNRPSAGGIVAGEIVARAVPDGHTLLITSSAFAGSAALYAGKLPYDPLKDFAPISQIASTPVMLVAAPNLGVKSVQELVALAKQKQGQLNFGSSGIGSGTHYAGELFMLAAGIKGVHVPYKGSAEVVADTIAGRLHWSMVPLPPAIALARAGRLQALAVTTTTRSHAMPDLPTVAEAGLPGFEYDGWFGIFAPGATPRRIVNRLSAETARILALPDVKEVILNHGPTPRSSTPEALDKLVRTEIQTRRKVFAQAGARPE